VRVRAQPRAPAIAFDYSIARALLRVRALFSGMISTRCFPIARKHLNLIPGNSRCSYNRRHLRSRGAPLQLALLCIRLSETRRRGNFAREANALSEKSSPPFPPALSAPPPSTEHVDIPHRVQNLPIYYGRKESTKRDRNVKNDSLSAVRSASELDPQTGRRGKDSLSELRVPN